MLKELNYQKTIKAVENQDLFADTIINGFEYLIPNGFEYLIPNGFEYLIPNDEMNTIVVVDHARERAVRTEFFEMSDFYPWVVDGKYSLSDYAVVYDKQNDGYCCAFENDTEIRHPIGGINNQNKLIRRMADYLEMLSKKMPDTEQNEITKHYTLKLVDKARKVLK